jgi:1-acyl-sn-glycerol-3-phosphate acyltransferase
LIRWLKFPYECLVFYGGVAVFGLIALLWSLTGALLHLLLPRRISVPLGRRAMARLSGWYLGMLQLAGVLKCDLSALDALRDERALIIAPNHPCLLDILLMTSQLPSVACIIRADLRDNLLYGGGARMADYICNRPPLAMIRAATAAVSAGSPLLIFPEGTRTGTAPVNRFKGGFALVAKASGAPVQTVFIETDSPFLGKGWPLWKKPAFPLVYRVRLGRRFEVTGKVHAFVGELEEYFRRGLRPEARLGSDPAPTRPFPAT